MEVLEEAGVEVSEEAGVEVLEEAGVEVSGEAGVEVLEEVSGEAWEWEIPGYQDGGKRLMVVNMGQPPHIWDTVTHPMAQAHIRWQGLITHPMECPPGIRAISEER